MGKDTVGQVDAWLRQGGVVVTSSDRASRAVTAAYQRLQQARGLSAWAAPQVSSWTSFVHNIWADCSRDDRLILSPMQELAIWTDIVEESGQAAGSLPTARRRFANMAMQAHALLCAHAPRLLDKRARRGWSQEPGIYSEWLTRFDSVCRQQGAISPSRLPLELQQSLNERSVSRAPLLLVGFDRVLTAQRALLDAWGKWSQFEIGPRAESVRHVKFPDAHSELLACAEWCQSRLEADPAASLLIITQHAGDRRGEIERALLDQFRPSAKLQYEFSLGVPLASVGIVRSALFLLHWLLGPLQEHEVDWLLASGHSALSNQETRGLQAYMRALRRRGLQRVEWSLDSFLRQPASASLPSLWAERLQSATKMLRDTNRTALTPLSWAELLPAVLDHIGWPGPAAKGSADVQARRRFQEVLNGCGALGFDGRRMEWHEFLTVLTDACRETLFSLESQEAPVIVAGPTESAGLAADGIWFLGVDEDEWPARGSLHPFLPVQVQRDAQMPHASPQFDWEMAVTATERLMRSASSLTFSYAAQVEGVERKASRVVAGAVGPPEPAVVRRIPPQAPLARWEEDSSGTPLGPAPEWIDGPIKVRGGSYVLTAQSQCAFKAFASARLGAQDWESAQPALTPMVRGQLLHAVLHAIWAGPPHGIRSLTELNALADIKDFVQSHVERALADDLPEPVREQVPPRYLELEAERLSRLVSEWLQYEAARVPFTVAGTELEAFATVGGLQLTLRLDRIDELNDGSMLIVDYKTGKVSPSSWELPRPEDVQLPLYAGFGLQPDQVPGGLVFAQVRPGEMCFTGHIGEPELKLGKDLRNLGSLKRRPLTTELLEKWRSAIEQLAQNFLTGRAAINPRDAKTCERCGLHTLCRVHELEPAFEGEEADGDDE